MRKFSISAIILIIIVILTGCGIYSFSAGGKSSIKTIAIVPFENKTIESGLSSRMNDLVINAFIQDGKLKVVSLDKAEAILTGVMISYQRNVKQYLESDNVEQYEVSVVFEITLTEPKGEKVIWKDRLIGEGIYNTGNETEEIGQSRAAEKLVVDIINRTTRSW